jgi:hypothetical protein
MLLDRIRSSPRGNYETDSLLQGLLTKRTWLVISPAALANNGDEVKLTAVMQKHLEAR